MKSMVFIDDTHAGNILQSLWVQCQREEYCDLVLIVGAKELKIPIHRNVLAAASPYFKDLFNKTASKEIKINTKCDKTLRKLYKFIYTGRLKIHEDNVMQLFEMANLFLLKSVVMACGNFISQTLSPNNCFKVMLLAEKYSCVSLLRESKRYCLKHFMEAAETDEFYNLNADQLSELLASDDLDVLSEEDVFNSLIRWMAHDLTERKKYKAELLRTLRMPLLERSFLINNVKQICKSTESLHVYAKGLESNAINPRNKEFLMATVLDDESNKLLLYYYCTKQLKWMKWSRGLEYRTAYSVATLGDNLYVVGGQKYYDQKYHDLNSVICVNLKTMIVSEIKPMRIKRGGCRAIALKGFLYVVGGIDLKSVEKWDPVNKTWSNVASMLEERYDFGIAVLNEKLYVVGGKPPLCLAEYYDPCQDIWTSISTLNEGRFLLGIAVVNDMIYAVGGRGGIKSVERYDPETNNWTLVRSLNEPMYGCISSTKFDDKVVVCYRDRIEEYNVERNEWIPRASSNTIRFIHRLFTYYGKMKISEFTESSI